MPVKQSLIEKALAIPADGRTVQLRGRPRIIHIIHYPPHCDHKWFVCTYQRSGVYASWWLDNDLELMCVLDELEKQA